MIYLLSVAVGLSFGLVAQRLEELILLFFLSYIAGAFASMMAVMAPALLSGGARVQIEIGFLGSAGIVIFNSFIIVPLFAMFALIGLFMSDRYVKGPRTPTFTAK